MQKPKPLEFKRLILGLLAAYLGDQMLMFAVPLLVYKTTGNVAQSGFAYALEWLPRVILMPALGVWVDRVGARRVILLSDALRVVASVVAFATLQIMASSVVSCLGIFAAICAIGNAVNVLAAEQTVALAYRGQEFPKKTASLQLIDQITIVIGPLLAAAFATKIEMKTLLLVGGGFYFLNYLNMATISFPKSEKTRNTENVHPSLLVSLRDSMQVLSKRPLLLALALFASLNNFIIGVLEASASAVVTGEMKMADSYFSLVGLVVGLNGMIAMAVVPYLLKVVSSRNLALTALLALGAAAIVTGLTHNFIVYIVAFGAMIATTLLVGVHLRSIRAAIIPPEKMAATLGVLVALNQLSLPLAGLAVGVAGSLENARMCAVVAAGAVVIFGGVVFARNPHEMVLVQEPSPEP